MAVSSATYCAGQCGRLVRGGRWCPTCGRRRLQKRRERLASRGKTAARGYGAQWQRIRAAVLLEEPMCRICKRRQATEVDHIKALADGGTHARENLRGVCRKCHGRKTAADVKRRNEQR